MKLLKNILVVFNSQTNNQTLLEKVVDLTQRNQAAVTVIDVIEEAPFSLTKTQLNKLEVNAQMPGIQIIEELPDDNQQPLSSESMLSDLENADNTTGEPKINIQEYIIHNEQYNFQQFISSIQKAGISVNSITMYGIPFIEIIRQVLRNDHDLVMISAEGEGGLKESLFGNTTLHLMRKCPCPVWVVKPKQSRQIKRILAAVDLAQDDLDRTALARNIIEMAILLAQSGQSELLILHAWSLLGESILRGRGGVSNQEIEELLRETQNTHRQWLIRLLQTLPLENLKLQVYLLKGDADNFIYELSQTKSIDLIVMGTVSRGGIAGLLIGNTAEKIIRKIDCSILTVKPEGFITPVKLNPE